MLNILNKELTKQLCLERHFKGFKSMKLAGISKCYTYSFVLQYVSSLSKKNWICSNIIYIHSNFHSVLKEVPDQCGVNPFPKLLFHQPVLGRLSEDGLDSPSVHREVINFLAQVELDEMSPYSCISLYTPSARGGLTSSEINLFKLAYKTVFTSWL